MIERGTLGWVEEQPEQANLTADAATSTTTLLVESTRAFDDDGGSLGVGGVTHPYVTAVEGVIELAGAGLAADASEGDPVVSLNTQGQEETRWVMHVWIDPTDTRPVEAEVKTGHRGYVRIGDADAGALVEVEYRDGGYVFVSRPVDPDTLNPDAVDTPTAKLYLAANSPAIPDITWTRVSGWTTGVANGFFGPTAGGWMRVYKSARYLVLGYANWELNTSGGRSARLTLLNVDGVTETVRRTVNAAPVSSAAGAATVLAADTYYLTEGQYVGLEVFQNSGAGLALQGDGNGSKTGLQLVRLGSA